ncbi:MAG: hypothetical protein IKL36_04185 [Clostridia bacterium]|nr:hypothetical protein [Clostridia bacterium]
MAKKTNKDDNMLNSDPIESDVSLKAQEALNEQKYRILMDAGHINDSLVSDDGIASDSNLKKDVSDSYADWKSKEKPSYDDVYRDDIEKTRKELETREFSYDVNEDEAYRRYRDSVKNSAELALADAMGLASSLTGGYSNSYAQLAGQAAFSDTIKTADEKVFDFYKEAYNRYSEETDNIEDRLEMLLDMDDTEWDRYIDMLDEYNDEGERLFDQLTKMSDEEFDRFYSMYKLSVK